MNRNKALWIAVKTIVVLACGLRGAGAVADAEKPNIIFVFSDDLSETEMTKTYLLVGDALGRGMIKLLAQSKR